MDIELHFLRHAAALCELKNFGKAAKSLNISQPALSRSIQVLEEKLGTPLFIRGTKSIELTDFGRVFIERSKELLNSANNFTKHVFDAGQQKFGRLAIGCGPYPAESVVASSMARFLKAYPHIEQKIAIRSPEELQLALLKSEMELIISEIGDLNARPDLQITPMNRHQACYIARVGHPLASSHTTLEQVLHYPLAMPTRLPARVFGPLYAKWKAVDGKNRVPLPSIECASLAIMKRIVMESDAITIMPLSSVETDLDNGSLAILGREPWQYTNYGIVQRKDTVLSQQANAFKNMLLEEDEKLSAREKLLNKRYKLDSG